MLMKITSSRRRLFIRLTAMALVALGFMAWAPTASAHPLGNFTINHYSRLELSPTALRVRFVLDFAEIPTFQERQSMDPDGDGVVNADDQAKYLTSKMEELRQQLRLTVGGASRALSLVPNSLEFQLAPGQGGLSVMRLAAWFTAPLSIAHGQSLAVTYRDDTYSDRLGWREIVVQPGPGLALVQTDVSTKDTSDELRAYPPNLLAQPLNEREAHFTFALGASGEAPVISSAPNPVAALGALDLTKDAFATLITPQELSLPVLLVLLLSAAALGAIHAFSPGHGKTIVGAYLVGSRGTAKHALLLGLVVTATHTSGVYALGLVTWFASRYIVPDQLYPWLGVISGALVAVIGGQLFITRLGAVRGRPTAHVHTPADGHTHSHPHAPHDALKPQDDENAEFAHAHSHLLGVADAAPTWQNLVALGISGGLLPCPSALVVMLGAIALGRIALGLVLIVAFSFGLAAVLIATGLILLYAGRLAGRFLHGGRARGWFFRVVPVGSAFVVMLLGIGIAAGAFMQLGGLP